MPDFGGTFVALTGDVVTSSVGVKGGLVQRNPLVYTAGRG